MHCLEVIRRLNDQFVKKAEEQFEFESYQRSDDALDSLSMAQRMKKLFSEAWNEGYLNQKHWIMRLLTSIERKKNDKR